MSSKVRRITNKLSDDRKKVAQIALTATLPGSVFCTYSMVAMEDEAVTLSKFMDFEETFNKEMNIESIKDLISYVGKTYYDGVRLPDTTAIVFDKQEKRSPIITILKPEDDDTFTPVPLRRDGWPTAALLSEDVGFELIFDEDKKEDGNKG